MLKENAGAAVSWRTHWPIYASVVARAWRISLSDVDGSSLHQGKTLRQVGANQMIRSRSVCEPMETAQSWRLHTHERFGGKHIDYL